MYHNAICSWVLQLGYSLQYDRNAYKTHVTLYKVLDYFSPLT